MVLDSLPLLAFKDPGHRITPDTAYDTDSTTRTLSDCTFGGDKATCQDNTSGWTISLGNGDDSRVIGAAGDDRLTGNTMIGHELDGGDGSDRLDSGGGYGVLDGGSGDDTVLAGGGVHQFITCGPGSDSVVADPTDTVSADCEDVSPLSAA